MSDVQEIKVQTKEWANPTPAGLVALAVAAFCFFGLLNGYVDGAARPFVGCWMLGGFVIQFIVAIVDLKGGNTAGGNTFLFFSAFFMLATGIEMFLHSFFVFDATIDGLAWLAIAIALILWTPAFCRPFGWLSLIIIALDIALPILALADLGVLDGDPFKNIAGYALLVAGIIALYLSSALVVNKTFGREIYPMLKLPKDKP